MSKQRVVKDEIWDDDWFYDLTPEEKLVWIFLLTNPRTNIAGIYKLNARWVGTSCNLPVGMVEATLKKFVDDGKIIYTDNWVGLVNFHKHLYAKNPSIALGVVRLYKEMTGCPQALYTVWHTLLNSTLLYLSDSEQSSPIKKEINEILMGWKQYNENAHSDDTPVIGDDGELVVDNSLKETNEKVTALIEWAEKIRGKRFLDTPTQRKMLHDLRKAKFSPQLIKDTFVGLVHSDYWQKQERLPDFKTVLSALKNKK